jgi:hypothetical protein
MRWKDKYGFKVRARQSQHRMVSGRGNENGGASQRLLGPNAGKERKISKQLRSAMLVVETDPTIFANGPGHC